MSKEAMKLALEAAYLAGFYASGEGYNGEYPFNDQVCKPQNDANWVKNRDDALREALAEQPAQQEPDWLDKEQAETDWDHVWLLIKAASYASSKGFISGTTNWGSAVSRYMRNESPQPAQQEPVAWMSDRAVGFKRSEFGATPTVPLYTSPPAQRTWVGLTRAEVDLWELPDHPTVFEFTQFVEAKLKEKNNGN